MLLFCIIVFTLMNVTTLSVANESNVPKASTEDISVKVSNVPSNNPSGRQTQCLNTQTEGATAKVNIFFACKYHQPISWRSQFHFDFHFTIHVQPPAGGWEAQEQHLLEMFPKCSLSEARSALSIAKGDMEEAVRLIIEGDVQLSPSPLNVRLRRAPAAASFMSADVFFCLTLSSPFCKGKPREEHFLTGRPKAEGKHTGEVSWILFSMSWMPCCTFCVFLMHTRIWFQ